MSAPQWMAQLQEVTALNHVDQAKFWLNAFWAEEGGEADAETIWKILQLFIELDVGTVIKFKGKKGQDQDDKKLSSDLDELTSHIFLERIGETLTVIALRARLKELDVDMNHRLAITEYLLSKFNKDPNVLVNAPQGDNAEEVAAAEALMAQVQTELKHLMQALEEQKAAVFRAAAEEATAHTALAAAQEAKAQAEAALAAAVASEEAAAAALAEAVATKEASDAALVAQQKEEELAHSALDKATAAREAADAAKTQSEAAEAVAQSALQEQKAAEQCVLDAEAELQAAVDALKAEEDAFNAKIADFESKKNDDALSAMKRAKASNELDQLRSEDPLPLRRAKITQEAALRRVQKERKKATAATAVAAEKATVASDALAVATERAEASRVAEEESQAAAQRATEATNAANDAAQRAADAQAQSEAAKQAATDARAESEAKAVAAAESEAASQAAAEAATAARAAAEEAAKEVERAVEATQAKVQECTVELERVKKAGGAPLGSIWLIGRELREAEKYLPQNKRTLPPM